MPFDAPIAPALTGLPDHRAVVPVATRVLEAHRKAQLRRFGPNAWHRHRRSVAAVLLGLMGMMGASAAWAPAGLPRLLGCALPFLVLAGFAVLVAAGRLRMRGGAEWQERWIAPAALAAAGVPAEIAGLARRMQAERPAARLVLGELVEDAAVLAPYLLLEQDGARVCLGIWDETGIVARAS
ncbi:MAG: hypothetical protein J0H57_11425 [Rhodospirillales bacterium]|nr:hypothetical protein [Rhodospirillales bacterium]